MKTLHRLLATIIAIVAMAFTATSAQAQANASLGFPFPDRVSQSPAEQDKRLEHLPGNLSQGVKTLRDEDYRTNVSQWSEKDRGDGLSDGQLSLDGDAGYPYTDGGFSNCNHIDYYTLNYKRVVKGKMPSVKPVDKDDVEQALGYLFRPIAKELRPLLENGYQVTRVRVPGAFNTSTEMTLVKVTEVGISGNKKYVVESLNLSQAVYDHCSMRRDPD